MCHRHVPAKMKRSKELVKTAFKTSGSIIDLLDYVTYVMVVVVLNLGCNSMTADSAVCTYVTSHLIATGTLINCARDYRAVGEG